MQPKNIRDNASLLDLTRCFAASDRQRAMSRRSEALLAAAGMEEPARRWFVVTVDSNADRAVAQTLAFADVEVWSPYVAVKAARRGGMKGTRQVQERLAMPGYVFAKVAATHDSWAGLQLVKGVAGILGSGGRPKPVADDQVGLLKAYLTGDPSAVKIVTNAVEQGDRVVVRDGPFVSFPGVVDRLDEDTARAVVDILIFGRVTPVHLDLAQLSKL